VVEFWETRNVKYRAPPSPLRQVFRVSSATIHLVENWPSTSNKHWTQRRNLLWTMPNDNSIFLHSYCKGIMDIPYFSFAHNQFSIDGCFSNFLANMIAMNHCLDWERSWSHPSSHVYTHMHTERTFELDRVTWVIS